MTATKEVLEALHAGVANDLIRKLNDNSISAQELSVAVKFLKDNGIEAITASGSSMDSLAAQFNNFDEVDMAAQGLGHVKLSTN
ncbi:MAG: hypothetical protein JKY49_00430 [Cohaesibacteraceae bacterium]|nr:hypothetical protein [Cohaesibacteraceae bacterium]MBL4875764.1 hypothetical protein [Cohaesibacteraceae bacterium]